MKNARSRVGTAGEGLACEYLIKNGHTILERNWRSHHLEVDIISINKDGLHFVEVKSRVAPISADPEENVGFSKQKNIANAANGYLHSSEKAKTLSDMEVFFDVVSIVFEGEKHTLTYFPNAYTPIYF